MLFNSRPSDIRTFLPILALTLLIRNEDANPDRYMTRGMYAMLVCVQEKKMYVSQCTSIDEKGSNVRAGERQKSASVKTRNKDQRNDLPSPEIGESVSIESASFHVALLVCS